jgi:crotonobetainyl-CoA:carnitine CoA-transferase CaiB-like acyl-CoA transferase
MAGPLSGIRIVDLTAVLMGPYATQILGDMGADVIKVEAPGGDIARQIGPMRNPGMGPVYMNANRSKRSLALNLKSPEGRDVLLRLAEKADVFVYNMRPSAMARLGLTYEDICKVNPKIIYVGMFGYSQNGPYANWPAYDDLIQGISTLPTLIARAGDGTPRYVPNAMADRVTGLWAVNAILAAIIGRGQSGKGQKIDVPMFETVAAFVLNDHLGGLSFDPPLDKGGYGRQLSSNRRPYKTKDGYICALIYTDKQWRSFFSAMGKTEQIEKDARFSSVAQRGKHIDEIYGEVSDMIEARTTAEWMELFNRADIPVAPMHDLESIRQDPHLQATGFFTEEIHPTEGKLVKMRVAGDWSETQPESTRPAPRLGEHSAEVLKEAGYSQKEIDDLRTAHVISTPAETHPAAPADSIAEV